MLYLLERVLSLGFPATIYNTINSVTNFFNKLILYICKSDFCGIKALDRTTKWQLDKMSRTFD